jgi:LAO/AO transport system kinase
VKPPFTAWLIFPLLKISGAGDEGIKRGIMEMADAIVINKADGDNIKERI